MWGDLFSPSFTSCFAKFTVIGENIIYMVAGIYIHIYEHMLYFNFRQKYSTGWYD